MIIEVDGNLIHGSEIQGISTVNWTPIGYSGAQVYFTIYLKGGNQILIYRKSPSNDSSFSRNEEIKRLTEEVDKLRAPVEEAFRRYG